MDGPRQRPSPSPVNANRCHFFFTTLSLTEVLVRVTCPNPLTRAFGSTPTMGGPIQTGSLAPLGAGETAVWKRAFSVYSPASVQYDTGPARYWSRTARLLIGIEYVLPGFRTTSRGTGGGMLAPTGAGHGNLRRPRPLQVQLQARRAA